MILTKRVINIRGLLRDSAVEAMCYNGWAVHRQMNNPELFCITLVHTGLSLPFVWASFTHPASAIEAMKVIARMRNSWAETTQDDLKKELEDQLRAICLRFGAIEGPVQIQQDCDKNIFGLPLKERVNGYRHGEIY